MKKISPTYVALLVFLLVLPCLRAQETRFFMPREIAEAYENGTRSYDGRPGPNYWQNTVDYQIEVEVFPAEKELKGAESAVYYNNSPDDLNTVVVRLYHDVFRKGSARRTNWRPLSPDAITDGVEITKLSINGQPYDLSGRRVRRSSTNLFITLNEPLPAGDRLTLEVDWAQQIPENPIRTGAYDETTFFIAYWYPQIAVYDDVFGWDQLDYDFQAEFYNNLANFDVKITAPDDFTVLSTGVLQNAEAVLAPACYERYQQAKKSTEPVVIVTPEDVQGDFHHRAGTWHYQAEEVSDFSFALSDHFSWDAATQDVAGRPVLINTFYPADAAEACRGVTAIQQKTMQHFSVDVPGVPYPYPEFTTFISSARGGGGMETPMMANNGGPGRGVTIHEMFHTYFPMYVRTNEKRFAWMDEGWANFNTAIVEKRYFEKDNGLLFSEVAGGINRTLGTISDLPLITSTQFTDNSNYNYTAYPLPAFLYATLHHHLGEELFLRCYREYILRWAQKSPTPYDFFYTFEYVSRQDLSWFWKPWFFEYGYADVEIQSYKRGKLTVENLGNRPVPIVVDVTYEDGTTDELSASAGVWKDSKNNTHKMKIPRWKEVSNIQVNNVIPDTDPLNNYYPSLQQRYAQFNISEDIAGVYYAADLQTEVVISQKKGMLELTIPRYGSQYYLIPDSKTEFTSLDGRRKVSFSLENGRYREVNFRFYGYDIRGVKK